MHFDSSKQEDELEVHLILTWMVFIPCSFLLLLGSIPFLLFSFKRLCTVSESQPLSWVPEHKKFTRHTVSK
jgi:hypothetical protein